MAVIVACELLRNRRVWFSRYPFGPRDAFVHLLKRQAATGADVVLGVCPNQPVDTPNDRLDIDPDGRVRRIAVKHRRVIFSSLGSRLSRRQCSLNSCIPTLPQR